MDQRQPLGAEVRITTADKEIHEGELFWYDIKAGGMLLQKKIPGTNTAHFTWISDEFVTNAKALKRPPESPPSPLPALDFDALRERLEGTLEWNRASCVVSPTAAAAAQRGPGTTSSSNK
ncbi:unnamed protein product [Amoebophrya sp. A120]|nr:unnamed protein product [Amoebophrya sp. A120]|eukprot:GSA120T00024020001.1